DNFDFEAESNELGLSYHYIYKELKQGVNNMEFWDRNNAIIRIPIEKESNRLNEGLPSSITASFYINSIRRQIHATNYNRKDNESIVKMSYQHEKTKQKKSLRSRFNENTLSIIKNHFNTPKYGIIVGTSDPEIEKNNSECVLRHDTDIESLGGFNWAIPTFSKIADEQISANSKVQNDTKLRSLRENTYF
ncbi:hypothetical protein ROZALSC1DRAFT_24709, partial [Rozella allomycis CSF55]